MPRFSDFDARGYRTVDVRTGYGEWVETYGRPAVAAMDIPLLEQLNVPWSTMRTAADLGCGTGRTGAFLRNKGVAAIDGIDLTPEMLAVARSTSVYRTLLEGDLSSTGLPAESYDVVTTSLVDEHLPDLAPLYRESWRLATPGGFHVLVGYHPHFMMAAGVPTHYDNAAGEPVAIDTHVHLLSEHVTRALDAGWVLADMREQLIDDTWIDMKPRWQPFRNHPITVAFAWRKP